MSKEETVKFGMFPKMLIAMVLVAVIPLGAIWLVNLQATTERISEHVEQQLGRVAEGLQGYVDTWVEMNLRMLQQNAQLPAIQSMDGNEQNPLLESITREYGWNYLAFTVAPDGNNVGRSDGKSLKYYGNRSYVRQVLNGADRGQQVLIGKTSGKPAFVLSVPILDEGKSVNGVLAIAMNIEDISGRVITASLGSTGQAFLVDEAGRVIAHQNEAFTKERRDLSSHPAVLAATTGESGSLSYVDHTGKHWVAHYLKTRYGWTLVTEQAHAEAFADVSSANRNALILLLVALVISVTVALFLSRRFSVPIQRLTSIAGEISQGKLDSHITYQERSDEIGALARSIDRLGNSIKLAMQQLSRQRNKARTA